MKVYGKNVLNEVLSNPKKIKKLYMTSNMKDERIMKSIRENKIQYESVSHETMNKMVKGNHQGIMAIVDDFNYTDYKSMYNEKLIVVLDHLEDPHNFGAIIRTCEAAGVSGIIIPKDRSVLVNATVIKVSTGAISNMKIARVTNIVKTIEEMKKDGFWIVGSDMNGTSYDEIDYRGKTAIVIGNEGSGMSRLVRESCDFIASIPMIGTTNSLNASVATGILIYEALRKRK